MHGSLEVVHWLGTCVLAASILVQILPPPTEIHGNLYLILFNTVRRIANLKMSADWNERTVVPTAKVTVIEQAVVGDRIPKEEQKP